MNAWLWQISGVLLLLYGGCLNAGEFPYPPAPGHEKLPVIFWGNYMPQIATGQIDQNGHVHGATDVFPFMTLAEDSEEQQIKYALDAGMDGFQSCTVCPESLYNAARKVYAKTGRMFYINPEWTDLGNSPEKAARTMADFALAQAKNPHLFRLDGKPMYFFYNHGSWGGSPSGSFVKAGEQDSRNVPLVKELMKKQGVEAWLLPSYFFFDKILLDRNDLQYHSWSAFQPVQPGAPQWLPQTAWDGMGNWNPCDVRPDVAAAMNEKLKGVGGKFIFLPAVWPGYDSSNRAWQAIHTVSFGLRSLRDNLRMWVTMGYRQINFITWNDVNETMLLPSTRSPFGFSEITRYYRQLAEDGTSPFDKPKAVVSYDSEVMYGDALFFQFLNLPEKNAYSSDYLCKVRLENLDGSTVATLTTRGGVPDQQTDSLTEARMDTTDLIGKAETLSPVISVYRISRENNNRMPVYENLRLPPITLRYNKIQFYNSYAIALDHVAPDGAVTLAAPKQKDGMLRAVSGSIIPLQAATKLDGKIRRLTLAESRLTCGAFRADNAVAAPDAQNLHLFLRVRCEEEFSYKIALSEGTILESYTGHYDPARACHSINAPAFETKSFPNGKKGAEPWGAMFQSGGKPVFRIAAPAEAKVGLTLTGEDKPFIETTLAGLAKEPLTLTAAEAGVKGTVRLELTLSSVELNRNYSLPSAGEYVRHVPLVSVGDHTRYFHAWALTEDDKVAYSRPVALVRVPQPAAQTATVVTDPETPVACPLIRTGGVFDDFIDSYSSIPRNPFTAGDVVAATLPARQVPYYLYDFAEGSGRMLNDNGTAHQLGRAWLTPDGCTWIANGWHGSALRLNGGQIILRSKSWPHGAYTFSARVRLCEAAPNAGAHKNAGGPLATDGDHYQGLTTQGLRIDILPDGKVKASRQMHNCEGTAVSADALQKGWNHVVVTHDLLNLRVYLNGKLSGEGKVAIPGYMRTHSSPSIGFSKAAKAADPQAVASLNGDLDQIEIIGTALTPEAVASLYEKGQWMAR